MTTNHYDRLLCVFVAFGLKLVPDDTLPMNTPYVVQPAHQAVRYNPAALEALSDRDVAFLVDHEIARFTCRTEATMEQLVVVDPSLEADFDELEAKLAKADRDAKIESYCSILAVVAFVAGGVYYLYASTKFLSTLDPATIETGMAVTMLGLFLYALWTWNR